MMPPGIGVVSGGCDAAGHRLDAREAEVEHLDAAVRRAHDVFGLEVAMRDAFRVRARERRRELARRRDDRLDRWPLPPGNLVAQRVAFDELGRDVELAVELLERIDGADAGMGQHRGGARFAAQPIAMRGSRVNCGASALSATVRPSRPSDARYTRPMPPRPISRTTV